MKQIFRPKITSPKSELYSITKTTTKSRIRTKSHTPIQKWDERREWKWNERDEFVSFVGQRLSPSSVQFYTSDFDFDINSKGFEKNRKRKWIKERNKEQVRKLLKCSSVCFCLYISLKGIPKLPFYSWKKVQTALMEASKVKNLNSWETTFLRNNDEIRERKMDGLLFQADLKGRRDNSKVKRSDPSN